MTDFDPYRALGIGRTAEPAAIKAAYRLKVQTAHPDRGGNADDFIAIVRAFGLLADPELRRLFDETGIVDLDSLQAYRRDVTAVLADMFDAAVQQAVASGLKLANVDFIQLMTSAVAKGAGEAQAEARRIDGEIDALTTLAGRIRRNDEKPNLFAERLSAQVTAKGEQRSVLRRRLIVLETAGVELGNYASEVELISALDAAP
jgi:curved DNA-binding protein CbpA